MPGNIINLTPEDMAAWPVPNYDDPPERTWLPGAAGFLYALSTVMLALRLGLRVRKQAGGLGIDDLMLGLAWFGSTMYTTVAIIAAEKYYVGRKTWNVPLQYFEKIAFMAWLGEFSFLWTGGCTKISVLLFYRRIVSRTFSRGWKWAIIIAICFTAGWTVAFLLTLVFNCMPTEAYWKAFNPSYTTNFTCANTTAINLLAGIFAIISDIYAVALPFIMTWNFQLSKYQRIALDVLCILALGISGVSGIRTYYLYQVGHNPDVSSMIFDVFWSAQVELQISILFTTLPSLRTFFRTYILSRLPSTPNRHPPNQKPSDRLSFVDVGSPQDSCLDSAAERGHLVVVNKPETTTLTSPSTTTQSESRRSFDLAKWERGQSPAPLASVRSESSSSVWPSHTMDATPRSFSPGLGRGRDTDVEGRSPEPFLPAEMEGEEGTAWFTLGRQRDWTFYEARRRMLMMEGPVVGDRSTL